MRFSQRAIRKPENFRTFPPPVGTSIIRNGLSPRLLIAIACCACCGALPLRAQETTPFSEGLELPGIANYAPANVSAGALAEGPAVDLFLDAKLAEDGNLVAKGLIWRIFGSDTGPDGKLPLLATAEGGSTRLQLSPGSYLVHAAFGRAGATTRITLQRNEPRHETMVLNAGGLRLEGVLPDNIPMREDKLSFDIYDAQEQKDGERRLILPDVRPGRTVRLNAGTYHVVSNYGDVNATIRADIRVEAGKTTTAKVEHRAAQVTLNLVRGENGFPLADTAWSILGPSGDIIAENVGAFPTMILAAGDYTVLAKNKNRVFQRDITIRPGRDIVVKVDTETAEQIAQ